MKKYRFHKGFTLIELLIVIAIIAILATIALVTYNSAQAKARDNKRKADVQAIASAYQIHYQETKSWKISKPELQRIPEYATTTADFEGAGGNGWFNIENATYIVSMAHALSGLGYLNPAPRDPLVTSNLDLGSDTTYRQYLKFTNNIVISIYAKLEYPTSADIAEASTGYGYGYGMNYAVNLK